MILRKNSRMLLARMIVRLGLCLLVLYSVLPMQLVLCHEADQAPRVEQALNGECLSSSFIQAGTCCSAEADLHPADHDAQHSLGISHEHCFGCRDVLVHSSQDLIPTQEYNALPLGITGGCLYSFRLPLITLSSGGSTCLELPGNDHAKALNLLRADCTTLLI